VRQRTHIDRKMLESRTGERQCNGNIIFETVRAVWPKDIDCMSKEIANFLNLIVRTIDNHRQNICRKLNLHGTHSLLKFAFDNSAYL
jgi:hypothetical protein